MSQELTVVDVGLVKRKRRIYSDDFKRELVQKCRHPHISIASVALEHGINTNLLNRWVKQASNENSISELKTVPDFMAIPIDRAPTKEISFKIQIPSSSQVVQLTWSMNEIASLAQLIRELTS